MVKGYRFLGGLIGDHDSTKAFIQKKIVELTNSVVKLFKVAESQPQAAFSALEKSLRLNGHTYSAYSLTLMMSMSQFKMQ